MWRMPSLALLEAYQHIPDDLSEQCAHYKFNEFLSRPHNVNSGLRTTDAPGYLARNDGKVLSGGYWPYIPLPATIDQMVQQGISGRLKHVRITIYMAMCQTVTKSSPIRV